MISNRQNITNGLNNISINAMQQSNSLVQISGEISRTEAIKNKLDSMLSSAKSYVTLPTITQVQGYNDTQYSALFTDIGLEKNNTSYGRTLIYDSKADKVNELTDNATAGISSPEYVAAISSNYSADVVDEALYKNVLPNQPIDTMTQVQANMSNSDTTSSSSDSSTAQTIVKSTLQLSLATLNINKLNLMGLTYG